MKIPPNHLDHSLENLVPLCFDIVAELHAQFDHVKRLGPSPMHVSRCISTLLEQAARHNERFYTKDTVCSVITVQRLVGKYLAHATNVVGFASLFKIRVRRQTSPGCWPRSRRLCLQHVDRKRGYELCCRRTRNWGVSIRAESHCTVFLDDENAVEMSVLRSCRSRVALVERYRRGTINFNAICPLLSISWDRNDSNDFPQLFDRYAAHDTKDFWFIEILIANIGPFPFRATSLVALIRT
jgi:hypothetical protein